MFRSPSVFLWAILTLTPAMGQTAFHDGLVRFDKRTFFPLGVWDPAGDYQGMAAVGMNCFLFSAKPDDMAYNRRVLDDAQTHDLKAILYFHYDQLGHRDAVAETVTLFKDHPALLAWNIGDDMSIKHLPRVVAIAELIKQLDRSHPVVGDAAHTSDTPMHAWKRFKPHLDIMMQYDYPIGLGGPPNWRSLDQHRGHLGYCVRTCGPTLWTFTQAFTWKSTRQKLELGGDDAEGPYPEPSQLRLLVYTELGLGEKGLVFFGPWSRIRKNPATVCEIATLAGELSPCLHLFATGTRTTDLKTSSADLRTTVWEHDGRYAVLIHRERPHFHRHVDSRILEDAWVEFPTDKAAELKPVNLGIEPANVSIQYRDGTARVGFSQVELATACLLTPDRAEADALTSHRQKLPEKLSTYLADAGKYQLQKVRETYSKCGVNLPAAEAALELAGKEMETLHACLADKRMEEAVAGVRSVYRHCRCTVEEVLAESERTSPLPKAAEAYRGLYYGMPTFFALAREAAAPRTKETEHRGLIINQSADAMFDAGVLPFPLDESTSKEEIIQGYKKLMDRYVDTQVSDVFLNVNFQRVCYQSEVWDSYWNNDDPETTTGWPRRSWLVHKKGVDPYAVCINHCREHGISPWISMRLNDTHYVNDPAKANTFWLKHPEYRRSAGGGFDYGIKEVRDHHLALIRELLGRYDADGLELDWMRFPQHFKPGREKQGCEVLTEFTRQVRELTGQWSARRGHPIRLAARVPAVPETAIGLGLDGVTWVQDGLIDVLIPTSTWKPTDTDIPIELWRERIGPAACARITLATGTDIWLQGYPGGVQMRDNLESMRGFTAAMLDRGADRIYLFNHFNAENDFKHTFTLSDGSTIVRDEYRRLLSQAARLETVLDKPRRHVLTFRDTAAPGASNPKQLPAVLTAKGKPARFRIYTGPRPSSGRVVLRAGLDDRPNVSQARLTARVNAVDCPPIADLNRPEQFIPHTAPGAHVVWSVEELARRVVQFEAPLAAVKRGLNLFELALVEGDDQRITWVEVYIVP